MAQCKAMVVVRGEMRNNRGRGFYRHYWHRECLRPAVTNGYCWQHQPKGETETSTARNEKGEA